MSIYTSLTVNVCIARSAIGRYILLEVMLKILKLKSSTIYSIDPICLAKRYKVVWLLLWIFRSNLGFAFVTYFEIYNTRPVSI